MPRDVSQSQASVPSRSMARISKPPPGNTTTAAPVFPSSADTPSSWAGHVGHRRHRSDQPAISSLTAGFRARYRLGVRRGPGHIATCAWPGSGCQSGFWAWAPALASMPIATMIPSFMTYVPCGAWPHRWLEKTERVTPPAILRTASARGRLFGWHFPEATTRTTDLPCSAAPEHIPPGPRPSMEPCQEIRSRCSAEQVTSSFRNKRRAA